MKQGNTVYIPFRLRNGSNVFIDDDVLADYDIAIYKAGVLYVPGSGPLITALLSHGRHILSFQGGLEDQYIAFIDHVNPDYNVSVESAWLYFDKFLTGEIQSNL